MELRKEMILAFRIAKMYGGYSDDKMRKSFKYYIENNLTNFGCIFFDAIGVDNFRINTTA